MADPPAAAEPGTTPTTHPHERSAGLASTGHSMASTEPADIAPDPVTTASSHAPTTTTSSTRDPRPGVEASSSGSVQEADSDDSPTPPATAKSAAASPRKTEPGFAAAAAAAASSIPPSTSTSSIFRPAGLASTSSAPITTTQRSLGKGHPLAELQLQAQGLPSRSASVARPPASLASPTASPSRARASARAPVGLRGVSARMPSTAASIRGEGRPVDNATETESAFSDDGEYYDEEGAVFSELEAMGDEAFGHQQRGRPKTFSRANTATGVGASQAAGGAAGAGKITSRKDKEIKGKGKGRAQRPSRPPLGRSRSRPPRDSDSDQEVGTSDPAPMLGGAAATGDIEDDEVERVDRGEELVRRRIKERQRLKKEAERKKKAEDQSKARQQAASPIGPSPRLPPPPVGAGRLKSPSAAPSPHLHDNRGRLAPSETGESSASASWEPGPGPRLAGSGVHGKSPREGQSPAMRTFPLGDRRQGSLAGSYTDDRIFDQAFDAEPGDGVETPHVTARGGRSDTLKSDYSGFFSQGGDGQGEGGGADTPTAGSPRVSARGPACAAKHFALSLPRSDSDMGSSVGIATPRSPILRSDRTSRGPRSVSYASTTRHIAEPSLFPEGEQAVLSEEPEHGHDEEAEEAAAADERTEIGAQDEQTADEDEADRGPQGFDQEDSGSDGTPDEDDVEYTLKDRQDAINIEHPFGLPIWKPALYKKSRSATRNAEAALHSVPHATHEYNLKLGNLVWTALFGAWLALVFAILSVFLFVMPWGGSKYGRVVWELAGYLFWPFGKYVEEWSEAEEDEAAAESGDTSAEGHGDPDSSLAADHMARWEAVSDIGDDDIEAHGRTWGRSFAGSPTTERAPLLLSPDTATVRAPSFKSPTGYGAATLDDPVARHTSGSSTLTEGRTHPGGRSTSSSPHKGRLLAALGRGENTPPIRVRALGRLSYWLAYYLVIAPLMLIACTLCWFGVFTIPMAKLLWVLTRHLGSEPLALHFRDPPTFVAVNQKGEGSGSGSPDLNGSAAPRLKVGQPAPKHSKKSLSASRAKGRLVTGRAKVLLCTYQAVGLQYYKYTVDGVNIIFIILMPFVIFVIFDAFFLEPLHLGGFGGFIASQGVIFVLALLSVIPLSYFIGMAVASISAQSSIGMGAVINATFGSIIEILLYAIALTKGKGELVEGSIIGSVLAGVLLMPGLSMIGGAIRRKEQKFNARSAGVTSTMLIMAIIGTLTPTLFYEIYGTFELTCTGCPAHEDDVLHCGSCRYVHIDPADDPFYQRVVRGLSFHCATILVVSYLIGLWFSLRTHASQIWQTPAHQPEVGQLPQTQAPPSAHPDHRISTYAKRLPELLKHQVQRRTSTGAFDQSGHQDGSAPITPARDLVTADDLQRTLRVLQMVSSQPHDQSMKHEPPPSAGPYHTRDPSRVVAAPEGHGGHDAPTWSRMKSMTVLLSCTVLYAVIAEVLVDVVDVVLDGSGIPEKFLGITLFALVPNTTEFMNAISFAINGNIALSMEIGSAYALQVCLIQIPVMILFSAIYNAGKAISAHHAFTLVFPRWDIIAIMFAVFLLTYTYIEARANYYRGSILVLSYLVLIGGFYAAPAGLDTADDPLLMRVGNDAVQTLVLPLGQRVMTMYNSMW